MNCVKGRRPADGDCTPARDHWNDEDVLKHGHPFYPFADPVIVREQFQAICNTHQAILAWADPIAHGTTQSGCIELDGGRLQVSSSERGPLFRELRACNCRDVIELLTRRMSDGSGVLTAGHPTVAHFRWTAEVSLGNQTATTLSEPLLERMTAVPKFNSVLTIEKSLLDKMPPTVKEIIGDMIKRGTDIRLLCRLIALPAALKGACWDVAQYMRALAFNYGPQALAFLMRMTSLGLLCAGFKWSSLLRPPGAFLLDWGAKGEQPAASYLSYALLSVRLVQKVVQTAMTEMKQNFLRRRNPVGEAWVIGFVSECTHSEINGLRRIGEQHKWKLTVVTTYLCSAKSFFDNVADDTP